ncbi:MAG: molybdopterin-guanine dinucleotide biosynthesis protein B [Pseudomonadota bacterium]|nr:molybdopterin-guanine dinucleotide biosynthesis protein B [Pseudomonadota bacterium]
MTEPAPIVGPRLRQIPNLLTAARVAVIPPLVGAAFLPSPWSDWLPFALFVAASITDWLDGVLARRWNAGSKFGQFMDPIADKLLVVAVILLLAANGPVQGWHLAPAIVILCREMFVSGLREFLANRQTELPVTKLAKWKTATQMAALTVLLLPWPEVVAPGLMLFWIAALLSAQTGYGYVRAAFAPPRTNAEAAPRRHVVGIAGWSGAGKTTLLDRLIPELVERGLTVSTVKHTHHAVDLDREGKDTYRHRLAGAREVMLANAARFALMREHDGAPEPTLDDLLARMAPVDIVLVEGFKFAIMPKLEVHRPALDKEPLWTTDEDIIAVLSDAPVDAGTRPVLDLDDVPAIADFLLARLYGTAPAR